jgi:hypothetical protein
LAGGGDECGSYSGFESGVRESQREWTGRQFAAADYFAGGIWGVAPELANTGGSSSGAFAGGEPQGVAPDAPKPADESPSVSKCEQKESTTDACAEKVSKSTPQE